MPLLRTSKSSQHFESPFQLLATAGAASHSISMAITVHQAGVKGGSGAVDAPWFLL